MKLGNSPSATVSAPGAPALERSGMLVALCQLAIVLLTLVDLVAPSHWAIVLLAGSASLFIALQWRQAPAGLRRTCTVLALATLALLPLVPQPVAALERGIRIGGLIGSLLLSVATLSRAAQRVSRLRQVMTSVLQVPRERRFATTTVASQCFGGFLGLAGITMMMEAASQLEVESEEEKLACFTAIARGYAAANLWSPMFSNLSILLAVNSGLAWSAVFPSAMLLALATLALGLALHRVAAWRRPRGAQPVAHAGWWRIARVAWPVLACMALFLVAVLGLSHWTRLPVAAFIIVLAPGVAWLLALGTAPRTRSAPAAASRKLVADFVSFRTLVGEVMLFFASGCAGTVIAGAIPVAWTAPVAAALTPFPILACVFLGVGVVLLSFTSVHPMLSGIVLASAFPAASLGLTPAAQLLSVLAGLGMAVIATPFSVISLMASRFSGLPLLVVSVRPHLGFAALNLLLVACILGSAVRYLAP